MQRSPEEAAPLAAGILKGLTDQAQRQAARGASVDKLVDAVVNLADTVVLPWARQQQFTAPQKVALEIRPARAQMLAGRWDAALKRFNEIIERYDKPAASNLDIVMGKSKCQYELGELKPAYEGFERAFNALAEAARNTEGEAMPPQYWEAALHMARIQDQWADGSNPKIYGWIEGLERKHDGLGGDRFRDAFEELQAKHRP
jgi:tetratricopeptide (TPR) repeat protein